MDDFHNTYFGQRNFLWTLDFFLFKTEGDTLQMSPCLFGQCNFHIFIKGWKRSVRLSVFGGREKKVERKPIHLKFLLKLQYQSLRNKVHTWLADFPARCFHSSRFGTYWETTPIPSNKKERISWVWWRWKFTPEGRRPTNDSQKENVKSQHGLIYFELKLSLLFKLNSKDTLEDGG